MPSAGARPKATKIYLIDCAWSRNLPKTQHTSYTHTLTLLKYFSSASHNIILSLSYDLVSYTLFLLFFLFFFIILHFFQSIEFMFHIKLFSSWFMFFVWKKFDHMNERFSVWRKWNTVCINQLIEQLLIWVVVWYIMIYLNEC